MGGTASCDEDQKQGLKKMKTQRSVNRRLIRSEQGDQTLREAGGDLDRQAEVLGELLFGILLHGDTGARVREALRRRGWGLLLLQHAVRQYMRALLDDRATPFDGRVEPRSQGDPSASQPGSAA